MFEIKDKPQLVERALLVGIYFERRKQQEAESLLDELEELVSTLGIKIGESICVFARDHNVRYLTGSGKAKEIMEHAKTTGCDCIIIDNELSPAQQRAWESESTITVIDREEVILDIFAMRARTHEARLQVELARMQYSLPRLKRMWAHLDRQGGSGGGAGGGAARGEGEQQIEVDRRLARHRIDRIKAELETVRSQRATQRKERLRNPIPHAAIVGYTNAGKSSLLNRIAGADVLEADMLFATLDPTTRKVTLPDGQHMLLTDTVGFVRHLPHRLVEAFKATLEESTLADFLIHVLDVSQPLIEERYQTTMDVLQELGAGEKRMLLVLNKIDLVEDRSLIDAWRIAYPLSVAVSLKTGEGLEDLAHHLNEMVRDRVRRVKLRIPQSDARKIALIHEDGKLLSQEYEGNDILVEAVISSDRLHVFAKFLEPDIKSDEV